jgi:hypothetical protein
MNRETPDNWIERQPIDDGPQHEDACMVCDKIDCICPPDCEGTPHTGKPILDALLNASESFADDRIKSAHVYTGLRTQSKDGRVTLFDIACQTAKAHNAAIREANK